MVGISVDRLIKKFGDKTAVFIPEFYFPENEIIGLVGNNGAGKTTLFRLILNLVRADGGTVCFNVTGNPSVLQQGTDGGAVKSESNLGELWKRFVTAYLDEGFLIGFLTPREFFTFIGKAHGIGKEQVDERLETFRAFLGDEILDRQKYIREYSAGNQQKIGIIAALLPCPEFVILDEPFNFLDPSSQNHLKTLLTEYRHRHHASVLLSSHNLHHTTDISDRVVLMENGSVIKNICGVTDERIRELESYFL